MRKRLMDVAGGHREALLEQVQFCTNTCIDSRVYQSRKSASVAISQASNLHNWKSGPTSKSSVLVMPATRPEENASEVEMSSSVAVNPMLTF